MLIHGFTPEEWMEFSKAERRVLALVHDMHYEREQICQLLEIKEVTLRFHIANIRRKQSRFREQRSKVGIAIDKARTESIALPEPAFDKERTVMQYSTVKKDGTEKMVTRNVNSGLSMKELLEPLDGDGIVAKVPNRSSKPSSPFCTIPNPTLVGKPTHEGASVIGN